MMTKCLLINEIITVDQCLGLKGIKLVLSMFQEIAFISNIMDLFKDDWGPDISLKDLNLLKHSISLNLHILILYNRV